MAYNNFSLSDVIDRFELNVVSLPFCENLPVAAPSEFFVTLFTEWFPLAQQAKSEKAKSELLVSPILLEVRKLVNNSVELFSGEEFSIDRERGLNGFCEFLFSRSTNLFVIQAPIVMLVEAKKGELDAGLGQCIAEMVAAQIFNANKGFWGSSSGWWKLINLAPQSASRLHQKEIGLNLIRQE